MKEVFPKAFLTRTSEVYRFRLSKRDRTIYALLVFGLILAAILLPFVEIPIYINARGVLTSKKDRVQILLIRSGKISASKLIQHAHIKKGDTLLKLEDSGLQSKLSLIEERIEQNKIFEADLLSLLEDHGVKLTPLRSARYQNAYLQYKQTLADYRLRLHNQNQKRKRLQTLLAKGVIAPVEYEEAQYEVDLSRSEMHQFIQQQRKSWHNKQIEIEQEIKQLGLEKEQVQEAIDHSAIRAPVAGTLSEVLPLENDTYINAGTVVAVISPDSELIAECYVSPSDVGALRPQTEVKIRIDAFDHNQWGFATGQILEVGSVVDRNHEKPVFRIRCSMDQASLSLRNGQRADLRKGLTLMADFHLADRSLMDLLLDRWQDWIDPSVPN